MASTYSSDSDSDNDDNMDTRSSSTLYSRNNGDGRPALTADTIISDLGTSSPYDPPAYEEAAPEENTKQQPSSSMLLEDDRPIINDRPAIWTLLDAYGSLSTTQLLDLLSPKFTHRVLPQSLDMPARNKEAFAQHAAGIFSVFESFKMDPREILKVDAWKETWVVYAHMEGVLKGGKGEWKNECVLIVKVDDQDLVEEIQEFVDSAKAVEMMKQHAPKEFGSGEGQDRRLPPRMLRYDAFPRTSFLTSICWFVVCVILAKFGAEFLALCIFWAHPALDALRRSFFVAPARPRL
ncbi:hypothetical protein GE09DRAFT_1274057 [Coniochaeta sp. 2T2.1]|nr:hypothetical protein GE09DRAFT_1274057 [Coniochaeta sp. 2T2.1]